MGSANSYSAKDELLKVARVICDAFDYNPGHSDLDANQPIWIGVTLGDWRKLHFALATIKSESESSGPKCGRWILVSERLPDRSDWYGVLDAQGEKRAAMFHVKSCGWIHNVVEPIQAWCDFPPTATRSE